MPSASELWPVTDTQAILPIICILNYQNQYSNINNTVMVDLTKKRGNAFILYPCMILSFSIVLILVLCICTYNGAELNRIK